MYPHTQEQTTFSAWLEADGDGGRPLARPKSPEAMALARLFFPRVYKAFSIPYDKIATALAGYGSAFSNQLLYPRLSCKRPCFEEQLQFMIRNLKGGTDIENTSRQAYPIFMKVGEATDTMVPVPFAVGLRVTGDGLIWFDGLAEESDGEMYCMYTSSAYINPLSMTLAKYIYVNLAFPMDHRVFGYSELSGDQTSIFSTAFNDAGFGPTLHYVDSPEAYFERHQVNSYPAPHDNWYEGSATTTAPLNRILMPGSERVHAVNAARRKLAYMRHPRRSTSWRMIGIHTEYKAGDWIGTTEFIEPAGADLNYEVQASLSSVTHDFQEQITTLGGLVSEIR